MTARTPRTLTSEGRKRGTEGIVIRERRRMAHDREAFAALQRDLAARLNHLRVEARETCEGYLANLEAEIAALLDFLDGSAEIRHPEDAKAEAMKAWAAALDALALKPRKGRRKDLRRIDQTVQAMMRTAFE